MISFRPTRHPRFITVKNDGWKPSNTFEIDCPTCNVGNISQAKPKWLGRCNNCGHIHNFFKPFPIQLVVTQIRAKIINNFGGTGSGKTTISSQIISESMRHNPGVKVVAFAQTNDQLKQTGKEELIKFFMDDEFEAKSESRWLLKNGSVITWFTSDSEQKIRGMNVGIAWLLESSGLKYSIFKQLMTRTRQPEMHNYFKDKDGKNIIVEDNHGRQIFAIDREKGFLINETNPTYQWPRDMALFKSHTIIKTPNVRGIEKWAKWVKPKVDPEDNKRVLDMVSIMNATVDNPIMTDEYMSTIRTTYDSVDEYNRDLYCDMSFKEGLIYDSDGVFIEENTELAQKKVDGVHVKWFESLDPGGASKGNDESAYGLFKLIVPKIKVALPTIVLVDGYKISGLSTQEEAMNMWKIRNRHGWSRERNINSVVDPHGVKVEKKSKSNLIKDLRPNDIYLDSESPSSDVFWGIKRVRAFIENGKFKVVMNEFGEQIKNEFSTYVWTDKTSTSRSTGNKEQSPSDKNNHGMDMIRFGITSQTLSQAAQAAINNTDTLDQMKNKREYRVDSLDPFAMRDHKRNGAFGKQTSVGMNKGGGIFFDGE